MEETQIDMKTLFPNLIVFMGPNDKGRLFDELKKSFNQFNYGPLEIEEGTSSQMDNDSDPKSAHTARIMCRDMCLAVGKGSGQYAAEHNAVEKLMKILCDTCYVIEANRDYFGKENVPACVLNPDPSHSDIFKVVCLKRNKQGIPFPHPLSGAIHYVNDYKQLLNYIETHGHSGSKADLFILNIVKTDRQRVKEACKRSKLNFRYMAGCSDQGIMAFRNVKTQEILEDLLKAGGKTVKYRLIGPRDQFNNEDVQNEEGVGGETDQGEEELVVNSKIADHLIILEAVNEFSRLELTKDIIARSVKDSPNLGEFVIEKTRLGGSGMTKATAMIDRNVVGVAKGLFEKEVEIVAAENAMENLRKCCYFIEAKKSYFGSDKEVPEFLMSGNRSKENNLYKIVEDNEPCHETHQILQQFKTGPHEDLFFLNDFNAPARRHLEDLAQNMDFIVRRIGRSNRLCVSKKRSPKQVLRDLMRTERKENEKYKLHIPPGKLDKEIEADAFEEYTAKIQGEEQQSWGAESNSYGSSQKQQKQQVPASHNRSRGRRNKRTFDRGPGFEQTDSSGRKYSNLFDTPSNVSHSNSYNDRSYLSREEGTSRDTYRGFDNRSENFQNRNQHWDRDMNQYYDKRHDANTDYRRGDHGSSRPSFQKGSRGSWNNSQQFKNREDGFYKSNNYGYDY